MMTYEYLHKNERGFFYFELHDGPHAFRKTRVWLSPRLVPAEPSKITFPIWNARVQRAEKGSLVVRPADGWAVYLIELASGYRGSAQISEIRAETGEIEIVARGQRYHSGRGALGETSWVLLNVSVPSRLRVLGRRTGRRIPEEERDIEWVVDEAGKIRDARELEAEHILAEG